MNTLIVRVLRVGRFGSAALAMLAVVALVALGLAIVFTATQASPGSATTHPVTTARAPISVSAPETRILPIDPSHLPASQYEFVAVSVTLSNTSSASADYTVDSFRLRDRTGVTFNPDPGAAYLVGASSALPLQGTLRPGERRVGNLIFQIPMSDHVVTLLWQPEVGAAASWTLAI